MFSEKLPHRYAAPTVSAKSAPVISRMAKTFSFWLFSSRRHKALRRPFVFEDIVLKGVGASFLLQNKFSEN